jgi:hypothetical protein
MSGSVLSVDERRLAQATDRACKAMGGLKVCKAETGTSMSRFSNYGSVNNRASISIRDAVRIDALGAREAGHPHILNTMASILGAVVIMLPDHAADATSIQMGVIALSVELGHVAGQVADSLAGDGDGGSAITPAEAEATLMQIADLERGTARLRHQLEHIVKGGSLAPEPPP